MTVGNHQPDLSAWQQHARRNLQLSPEATDDDVRREAVSRVQRSRFVPPADDFEAIDLLCGHSAVEMRSYPQLSRVADVEALNGRVEIDRFRAGFFDMPLEERRKRFAELEDRCREFSHLVARLQSLRAGLDVDARQWESLDDEARELGTFVRRLFTAPPCERALLRRRQRELIRENAETWERAARKLRRSAPDVAKLEPEFMDEVAQWTRTSQRRQRLALRRQSYSALRRGRSTQVAQAESSSTGPLGYGGLFFVSVAIGLMLAVLRPLFDDHDGRRRRATAYKPPTFSPYIPPGPRFDRDSLAEMILSMRSGGSLQIIRRDAPLLEQNPDNVELRKRLAGAYAAQAHLAKEADDVKQALEYAAQAHEHGRRLAELDPMNAEFCGLFLSAAWTLGDLQADHGSAGEALKTYQAAIEAGRTAVELHAEDVKLRRNQAALLNNFGARWMKRGQPNSAAPWFAESLEHAEFLVAAEPRGNDHRSLHQKIYGNLALAYKNLGRAADLAAVARRRKETCHGDGELLFEVARDLATAARLAQEPTLVVTNTKILLQGNAVEIASSREWAAESLELLQAAVEAGYANLAEVHTQDPWKVVRELSAFQDFVRAHPTQQDTTPGTSPLRLSNEQRDADDPPREPIREF